MDPFIGEIIMFGGNFAPRGWALCDGQLLSIATNPALFSILGTTYGGDGRTTFGLPDLRGRAPMHAGTGPGLSMRRLGQSGGSENVTLNANEIPSHDHTAQVPGTSASTTTSSPLNAQAASTGGSPLPGNLYNQGGPTDSPGQAFTTGATGGNGGHNNMPPFGTVNFIIALVGIFPSRS